MLSLIPLARSSNFSFFVLLIWWTIALMICADGATTTSSCNTPSNGISSSSTLPLIPSPTVNVSTEPFSQSVYNIAALYDNTTAIRLAFAVDEWLKSSDPAALALPFVICPAISRPTLADPQLGVVNINNRTSGTGTSTTTMFDSFLRVYSLHDERYGNASTNLIERIIVIRNCHIQSNAGLTLDRLSAEGILLVISNVSLDGPMVVQPHRGFSVVVSNTTITNARITFSAMKHYLEQFNFAMLNSRMLETATSGTVDIMAFRCVQGVNPCALHRVSIHLRNVTLRSESPKAVGYFMVITTSALGTEIVLDGNSEVSVESRDTMSVLHVKGQFTWGSTLLILRSKVYAQMWRSETDALGVAQVVVTVRQVSRMSRVIIAYSNITALHGTLVTGSNNRGAHGASSMLEMEDLSESAIHLVHSTFLSSASHCGTVSCCPICNMAAHLLNELLTVQSSFVEIRNSTFEAQTTPRKDRSTWPFFRVANTFEDTVMLIQDVRFSFTRMDFNAFNLVGFTRSEVRLRNISFDAQTGSDLASCVVLKGSGEEGIQNASVSISHSTFIAPTPSQFLVITSAAQVRQCAFAIEDTHIGQTDIGGAGSAGPLSVLQVTANTNFEWVMMTLRRSNITWYGSHTSSLAQMLTVNKVSYVVHSVLSLIDSNISVTSYFRNQVLVANALSASLLAADNSTVSLRTIMSLITTSSDQIADASFATLLGVGARWASIVQVQRCIVSVVTDGLSLDGRSGSHAVASAMFSSMVGERSLLLVHDSEIHVLSYRKSRINHALARAVSVFDSFTDYSTIVIRRSNISIEGIEYLTKAIPLPSLTILRVATPSRSSILVEDCRFRTEGNNIAILFVASSGSTSDPLGGGVIIVDRTHMESTVAAVVTVNATHFTPLVYLRNCSIVDPFGGPATMTVSKYLSFTSTTSVKKPAALPQPTSIFLVANVLCAGMARTLIGSKTSSSSSNNNRILLHNVQWATESNATFNEQQQGSLWSPLTADDFGAGTSAGGSVITLFLPSTECKTQTDCFEPSTVSNPSVENSSWRFLNSPFPKTTIAPLRNRTQQQQPCDCSCHVDTSSLTNLNLQPDTTPRWYTLSWEIDDAQCLVWPQGSTEYGVGNASSFCGRPSPAVGETTAAASSPATPSATPSTLQVTTSVPTSSVQTTSPSTQQQTTTSPPQNQVNNPTTVDPSLATLLPPPPARETKATTTLTATLESEIGLQPPPPPSRPQHGALQEATGLSAAETRAVVGTAYGSSVAASLISPTAASKGTSLVRFSQIATCEDIFGPAANDDDGDWPEPFMFIATPALEGQGVTVAKERQSRAVGALVVTSGVVLGSTGLYWFLTHQSAKLLSSSTTVATPTPLATRLAFYMGVFHAILLTFYGPNVTEVATTLLLHGSTALQRIVSLIAIALCSAPAIVCAWFVTKRFDAEAAAKMGLVKDYDEMNREMTLATRHSASADANHPHSSPLAQATQMSLRAIWEPARELHLLTHRLLTFEDLLMAHVVALLSGIRPSTEASCRAVLICMVALSLLHIAYLIFIRPYRSRLEFSFALALGGVVTLLGLIGIAILLGSASAKSLGYVELAADALIWMQLVVLTIHEVLLLWSRRRGGEKRKGRSSDDAAPTTSNDDDGGAGVSATRKTPNGKELAQQQHEEPLLSVVVARRNTGDTHQGNTNRQNPLCMTPKDHKEER